MSKLKYAEMPWSIEDTVETAEKLRAYMWSAMEVIERHKDRPDMVEEGKERIETLKVAEEAIKKQIELSQLITDIKKDFNKDDTYSVSLVLELLESVRIGGKSAR